MRHMGCKSCKADPDFWFKQMMRLDDVLKYYVYIMLYVNDCLAIHHNHVETSEQLDKILRGEERIDI